MTHDLCHITFYYWHWHKIWSHQFANPFFGTLARSFHFCQWLNVMSAHWRLVLHILVTCVHMSTSAGSRVPYMVFVGAEVIDPQPFNMCGPSEDPLSWRVCLTGSGKAERVSRSIGIFYMDLANICKLWSLIKMHDLLMCDMKMML